jgi:zinc transporter
VFLPLTFLTGLLGVNLAGIPFATEPWVFWSFCAMLTAVALLSLWLALRLLR